MKQSKETTLVSTSGTQVVTAFVNGSMNTDDACSVWRKWAQSSSLAWSGYINYSLTSIVTREVGMRVGDKSL